MFWSDRGSVSKIIAALLLGGAVFLIVLMMENSGAVARGVSVGAINTEKFSYEELAQTLQREASTFENARISLVLGDVPVRQVLGYQLGVSMDATATLEATYNIGRDASFMGNALAQLYAFITGTRVPFTHTVSRDEVARFVEEQLSDYHRPAQEIVPRYDSGDDAFFLTDQNEGVVIDIDKLVEEISLRAGMLESSPISLTQHKDIPSVTYEGAQEAYAQASALLSLHPFSLTYSDTTFEIEKEDWISWLDFYPDSGDPTHLILSFSEEKIEEYLIRFAPGINETPINAEFSLGEERVTAFALSRPGRDLQVTESAAHIKDMLVEFASGNEVSPIALFLRVRDPIISSETINDLGITALLGKGESDFAGSPDSRVQNIRVGSDKFHGTIVGPGEEFSFNILLGNVTAKEGYLPELVIKNNKTIPEYGGGLCQVSTTLFRAAVLSGLEITQRYNHSYPVVYYGTPGFDATIYPMNPDMRFRNTTAGHILLQYKIEGTKFTWEIYGTDDGRTVTMDGPHIYDKKPDGSMKAWFTQSIFNADGSLLHEKTFYSNYKSPSLYPIDRNPLE